MANSPVHIARSTDQPRLSDVAHRQCDELWDVIALLEAAAHVASPGDSIDADQANRMRRLVRVAEERVRHTIAAFDPYV